MPKVEGKCQECGESLLFFPSQMRKFCSQSCRAKCMARGGMPLKPRTGVTVSCLVCSEPVWRTQHQIKAGIGLFCSIKCKNVDQRVNRVPRVCQRCGEAFEVVPSFATRQSALYCSRRCMALAKIKRPLDREHNGKPARLDNHGYVLVWEPEHHNAKVMKGWVYEHRLMAEQVIGRPLTSKDEVHHINRDKADNRPENLSVVDGETHATLTAAQRQSDRDLLAEYMARFGPLT